ncbi:MAG: arylsulfatase, partial [Pirellulaceae bacterium]|nr:arylsulfatase [Pirellulaceae bacterium]
MKCNLLFALFAIVSPSFAAGQQTVTTPPSIVFILADDMGIGDVQCFNPEGKIKTPCMDRLASEGMRLNDAHSPSAVCTPTRYGILTGRYAWRGRLKNGVLWGASDPLIEEGRPTVPSLLRDAGYATACVGKWHLGLGIPKRKGGKVKGKKGQHWDLDYTLPLTNTPLDHGFDHFYGISASLDMPPYWWIDDNRWTEIPTVSKAFFRLGAAGKNFEAVDCLDGITTHAVDWIKETTAANPKQPFFLYVPLTAPHTPIVPSKNWKGKSGIGDYADFVMEVDDTVGRISDAVRAAGRANSTLFIVTSDNGCAPKPLKKIRKHGHDPSGGFRGQKADIYEGGHRVPFIARWPGHIVEGSRSTETVCLTDLFATAADLTGRALPPNAAEDSVSLL